MNSFLLLALLLILLLLLIGLLKKAAGMFKSTFLFLIIFIIIIAVIKPEFSKAGNTAGGISTVKNWVYFQLIHAGVFFEEHFNLPIVKMKDQVHLNVPAISQLPELPRGCEVTSLSMLLNYDGIHADKMKLAQEIKKDHTPHSIKNGKVFFGNPNDGFVGNMYSFDVPGFGVYHKPIAELAEKYLPGKIKDLTGSSFQELKIHLSDGRPVLVITNTLYQKLDNNLFQTWDTPTGKVTITYNEHAVLLTGYDQQFVYFNDPLTGENKKAPTKDFEASWVQMGSQAITYLP